MSSLKFLISLQSIYGGFDTIKSNFLLNILFKDLFRNFTLLVNLNFKAFFLAVKIAFLEISTPIPLEFFRPLNKLIIIQPDPVPISNILILECLFFINFILSSTIPSVSGLGSKTN